ncbi:hypothetical protein Syun_001881 [Stephania yunnanensis]|uniref:Signal recognition particle receptor subunit beta n=1 Tax=Stephania yunnanensis TaxID=152371 RepID=A0AAP0LEY7_9MAGN
MATRAADLIGARVWQVVIRTDPPLVVRMWASVIRAAEIIRFDEMSYYHAFGQSIYNQLADSCIVDVPGHARLRPKLDDYLPQAGGVVFVVDTLDFLPSFRAAAGYLIEARGTTTMLLVKRISAIEDSMKELRSEMKLMFQGLTLMIEELLQQSSLFGSSTMNLDKSGLHILEITPSITTPTPMHLDFDTPLPPSPQYPPNLRHTFVKTKDVLQIRLHLVGRIVHKISTWPNMVSSYQISTDMQPRVGRKVFKLRDLIWPEEACCTIAPPPWPSSLSSLLGCFILDLEVFLHHRVISSSGSAVRDLVATLDLGRKHLLGRWVYRGDLKKKIPVLLLCNKTDKVTAHTKEFTRKQQEKEIDKLRASRTAISSADSSSEFTLGLDGEAFTFFRCHNKVEKKDAYDMGLPKTQETQSFDLQVEMQVGQGISISCGDPLQWGGDSPSTSPHGAKNKGNFIPAI